jgi:hypothetical protein
VKRWRERDYDPDQDARDEAPHGPLSVEPIATRSNRAKYGLPVLIVAFVIVAWVVATVSSFVAFFSGPVETPPPPTPIAWVDTTVGPAGFPSLTPAVSLGPGQATPSPPVRSIRAVISPRSYYWYRGTPNHFTLELTNTSQVPISMRPCPAYRMYLAGTDASAAPLRLLNCAAIGPTLEAGQSISLDMVYTPTTSDPLGSQTLGWWWVTPDTIQAVATITVFIGAY